MVFGKSNSMVDAILGFYGARQIDGHWYAYVGGITWEAVIPRASANVAYPDLYRVELDTGRYEMVAQSGQHPRGWLLAADGKVIASSSYEPGRRQWTIFAGAGNDRPLLQRTGDEGLSLMGPGRTPGTIVVGERTAETIVGREVRLDGSGEGDVIVSGDNTAREMVDPVSRAFLGIYTERGAKLVDPALQKRVEDGRAALQPARVHLVSIAHDVGQMIFVSEGSQDSGRYWYVDLVGRRGAPIGEIRPDIPPPEVGPVRMFAYKAADGLALEGVLTLPPGKDPKKLPLVVMPHGGPIVAGDRPGFDWWAQAFASRGYAVLQPNYRGTLGYGEAFRKAADGQMGRKMQTDVSDGVAALAAAGIADPKRVCIVGDSYGGYAALAGVTLQQGLYRCAVSVSGVADIGRMLIWIRERSDVRDQRAQGFWRGLGGAASGDLDAVSPLKQAAKADAPVLLVHGDDDTVVPIEQSRLMQRALASAGRPVEFVPMNGEDHWLSSAATRQAMLSAVVAFVQKHNPAN